MKKLLVLVFVFSVSVSGVSANTFWETIFGSNQTALVDSVEFSVDTFNVAENAGNAVITVQRTGGGTAAFSVDYQTSDSQATQPNDYTLTSGTLNFATGETSKQILVPIINDIDVEVLEGFQVYLNNPTNGVILGSQDFTNVNINSDEPFVAIYSSNLSESTDANLTFTRGGNNLNQTVTVDYATSNNTASAGQDYTSQSGTITFAPNEIEKYAVIPTLNDLIIEPIEDYNVTLSSPTNATIVPIYSVGVVTIYDDDQSFVFIDANNSYNVSEGNNVIFSFYRTGGDLSLPVSVQFSTADGSATSPADYTAQTGTVSFAANETYKTISVPTITDTLSEPTENFSCTLSNSSSGTLIFPGSGTATVNINDASTLAITNSTVVEGATAALQVTRSGGDLSQAATVNFATANGTAVAPGDYTQQNGTLNFAANETTKTISVVTIDDSNLESTETLTVTLSNPSSGTSIAGTGISTVTITDNEVPSTAPRIAFVTNRDGDKEIYGINTDATYLANISNSSANFDDQPDFNFTNGKFVFRCEGDLCTMNADGSNASILFSGSVYQPSWSPSGQFVVFTDQNSNSLKILDTSTNAVIDVANGLSPSGAKFSPDNLKITFIDNADNLYTINRDGTNLQTLTGGVFLRDPRWSPDGTKIVFSMNPSAGSNPDVFIINSDGTSLINLTNTQFYYDQHPTWSPDGTKILFSESNVIERLRTITPTGAPIQYLGSGTNPNWSPDGTKIICLDFDSQYQVKVLNSDGSNPVVLQTNSIQYEKPIWIGNGVAQNPSVGFEIASSTINEDGTSLNLTVRRTGNITTAFSVNYATESGTATTGSDFTSTSGTLNFASGETSKTITIPINNDSEVEANETFTVNLSNATNGATITLNTHTATITDNEPSISLSANPTTLVEGNVVSVTLTRTGDLANSSQISFSTTSGTAIINSDFTDATQTVTFAATETAKVVSVQTTDDSLSENNETFGIQISNPIGATLGSATLATIIITDNEAQLSFNPTSYQVNEDAGNALLTVERTQNLSEVVTVNYQAIDVDSDGRLTPTNGILTFNIGEATKTISVPIVNDLKWNSLVFGRFNVNLSSPSPNAKINSNQANVTIIDNEDVFIKIGTNAIPVPVHQVNEAAGAVVINFIRTGNLTRQVTFNYSTTDLTATSPADYTTTNGTMTFLPNETQKTVSIPIINEAIAEPIESFRFQMTNFSDGLVLNTFPSAQDYYKTNVEILNDDSLFEVENITFSTDENVGSVVLKVKKVFPSAISSTVGFETVDGTAVAPTNYTSTSGILTFPSGVNELNVSIPVINNSLFEPDKNFILRLINPTNGSINVSKSETNIKIWDDEFAPGSITARTAILGTAGAGNQAVVFRDAGLSLPTTPQVSSTGLPTGSNPHGLAYFGLNRALISDFGNSRILVTRVSDATVTSVINTSGGYIGTGTIAVAPNLTTALAIGGSLFSDNVLYKIQAPFTNTSQITSITLPGGIEGYQTQAIVFDNNSRAFVYHSSGISVLDYPYNSIAFTIPVSNPNGGAIAISPDGNTLLTTKFTNQTSIFQAPFSTATPQVLTIPNASSLDGIMVAPNGQKAIVVDASQKKAWAISAPFTGNLASVVEEIPLPASSSMTGFEDVGISADSQVAIITGNDTIGSPPIFIKAPFGATSQTYDVPISGANPGRGAGAVRFIPSFLLAPTAASATVSGRITTAGGRGIARVFVTLTDTETGETRRILSSQFGYYRFDDVAVGKNYVIAVAAKRYVFEPNNRVITPNEDLTNEDFIAENVK